MAFFKRVPLEVYILLCIPVLLMAVGATVAPEPLVDTLRHFEYDKFLYYLFFGYAFFKLFFLFVYIFVTFKLLFWASSLLQRLLTESPRKVLQRAWDDARDSVPVWKSFVWLVALIQLNAVFTAAHINQIGSVDPERVAANSTMLLEWDAAVFGSYVPFALQSLAKVPLVDALLAHGYTTLSLVLGIVLIGLLLRARVQTVRLFVLSFFFCSFLAIPVWATLPAVTPYELYGRDILPVERTTSQAQYAETQLEQTGTRVADLQETMSMYGSKPSEGHYHIPTFPSMHIAWGTLALIFGFVVARWLGFVLVPWYVANVVGSFYTLQHYAVDYVPAIVVVLCAIWVVHRLLKWEEATLHVPDKRYSALQVPGEVVEQLRAIRWRDVRAWWKKW